jgi:LmbE family N-acetylglucosaminyl deacetylase
MNEGMTTWYKKVLVLAPHTDDGELGAGGFIAKLVEAGTEVHYIAFSIAEESVPIGFPKDILQTEVENATSTLGIDKSNLYVFRYKVRKLSYARQEILEDIVSISKKYSFDLILMPSMNDIHQDHAVVAQEGLRAFKNKSILSYELVWNNISFQTQAFVPLELKHLEIKKKALQQYNSQKFRSYMNDDFIFSLAKVRGVQFGVDYAEVFEVIRFKI